MRPQFISRLRAWYTFSDADHAPAREVIAYGIGGACAGMPGAAAAGLAALLLNVELGVNPAHIGIVMSMFIVWDAVNDPVFAHITDNTRSRWGRRRPYIAVGGVLIGLFGVAVMMMPAQMAALTLSAFGRQVIVAGHLVWFGIAMFFLDIGTTVFFVPHYALGIELSPTYAGRTRVSAWRSIINGFAGFLSPWFYRFCLIGAFGGMLYGARVLMIILGVLSAAGGILTARICRERAYEGALKQTKKESFFKAVKGCAGSYPFWRITLIYVIMLFIGPLFEQFGTYVSLFYVFQGDKVGMAKMGGIIGMLGIIMSMLGIPLFAWLSQRFGKHNALRTAIGLFIIGHLMKLVVFTPACPALMLLMPFVFSVGISATYTVLSAMQADIVDVDELSSGQRREGMFGAVASVVMKSSGALATGIAGFAMVLTGYDVAFGANQSPGTFLAMRLLYSLGPIPFLLVVLALLYRYPFTAQRIQVIHEELKRRHAAAAAQAVDLARPGGEHA